MSATKFIAELERRRLLSERLMARLRDSLAGSQRPLSAEAIARFLVQKKQLSEEQAREVLNGLSQSGVDLVEEDAEGDGEKAEESSIFAAHITGDRTKKSAPTTAKADDDDEIRLVPLDEDFANDKNANDDEADDLPVLGVAPVAKQPATRRSASPPPPAQLPELGHLDDSSSLVDLESGAGAEPIMESGPTARRTTSLRRGGKKKTKKKLKSIKERKKWDSPLILIGGGGLTLLLLIGGTVWWLLGRESGDQILAEADAARKSGAYVQAIEQYQAFLKDYPRHAQHSLARVDLALVRIRQPADANDFASALTAAKNELKSVEDEDAFNDERGEVAALLPQIALGLAAAAEKANPTSDDARKFSDLANEALALCNNATYIPKSLRDEAKLTAVQDTLDRAARRQQSQLALAEGLKAMQQAVAAGKPMAAYAAHRKLLKTHPELAGDANLAAAILKTTAAEQAAIRFVKEAKVADATERPTPWRAALAVANRRVKPAAPIAVGGVACFHVDSAVYAVDAGSGHLLWRRNVGFGSTAPPILIERDVIITDATHNELLRIDATTNRLVWRQSLGEPFAEVLVAGDSALVPTKSGRLYVIDVKTGGRSGYLQFAQPLNVAPTIDRQKTRIYLPGDEATLYSVSLADMKCIGVNYLGHAPGSIRVPVAAVMDKVAAIENDGVETCRLRLMALDDKGAIGKQVADRRLNGLAASPPIVTGRGMIVVTDRGMIEVYDIASGSGANALTLAATRNATGNQPLVRYIAVTGRNVWIADTQLTKYSIVPTGNRLPVEEIENNFAGATFNQPLLAFGDVLIHERRPKDRAGFVVAATDTRQGRTLWETDLAMPPAGPPVVDEAAKALAVATSEGYVFRFDEAAIRSRVQDESVAAGLMPAELPALTETVDLGQGRAVFGAPGSNQLLLYNPAQGAGAKWLPLESPLACLITTLGQGFVAPLKIGQVFYLNAADGARLATPFQPRLEPQSTLDYKPAAAVGNDGRQFVITDGRQKIYLVALADSPQPHLEEVKQADVGPHSIDSPVVVLGDTAVAVAGGTHVLRFKLPTLETAGETILPAPLEWGPYRVGDMLLVATAGDKILCLSAAGEVKWQAPTQHGALAGPPLALPDSIVLAFRKGIIERRSLADGKPQAAANLEQPVATGPVAFLQRIVVAAGDGTLLVVDQP